MWRETERDRNCDAACVAATRSLNVEGSPLRHEARGDSSDNPTDPQLLTDEQASKGVQFFFTPKDGHIDASMDDLKGITERNIQDND